MQKIPIRRAAAGMKLAKPVTNKRGMILYGAGVVLTADIIARLSEMEVEQITIEGHPPSTAGEEKSLSLLIKDLNARFRYVEEDPLMGKMKNLILTQLKERA
ncbi:MAG TPA: hypothetical protein VMW89_16510 [Desulfatiglandales bacterium]|nr:hypothetical protein [Desulfatiglandales bacterium]